MWKNRLGSACVYLLTTLFIAVFVLVLVSGLAFALFIFSGPALAVSSIEENAVKNAACLNCHGREDLSVIRNGKEISLFVSKEEFEQSIHGTNACTSCHQEGVAAVPHKQPIYGTQLKREVSDRCGACHSEAAKEYASSVHDTAAAETSAACSDCHGSHGIRKKEDAYARYGRSSISATCAGCHNGKVWETYNYSFHGTAVKFGYPAAATCADCHGTHRILPVEDPLSLVSTANRPKTCANCHFYAREGFAKGKEHVTPRDKEAALPLYIVWKIFILLILFDAVQGGSIVIFELLRQLRSLSAEKRRQHQEGSE